MPSDSVTFNGKDLSSLVMVKVERPVIAPVDVYAETIPGAHGEVFKRARLAAYDQPITIWLRSEDRRKVADIRHELAALLWTDEPAPLVLPDDPDKYHLAILTGESNLGAITDALPTTTLNFRITDPVAYGELKSTTLSTGNKSVKVGGTWPTKPVVRATTSGGNFSVTNVTTGEFVKVDATTWGATIASGASVVIDMALERVTINGTDAGVTIGSDFFELEGTKTVKVAGLTDATMEWRERWL